MLLFRFFVVSLLRMTTLLFPLLRYCHSSFCATFTLHYALLSFFLLRYCHSERSEESISAFKVTKFQSDICLI